MFRRDFMKGMFAAGAATALPGLPALAAPKKDPLVWAGLVHIGINMWSDHKVNKWLSYKGDDMHIVEQEDHIRCDEAVWNSYLERMHKVGMNMIVLDLGEGIQYPSHPELAVKGSWSVEKTRKELAKCRALGLEPIPKMNFSASHDAWLKEYSHMLSTETYYKVCADVIKDVCEIFDHPRWFHLGYDEETAGHQAAWDYVVVRQGDLWWKDFLYITRQALKNGSRPLVWSDRVWWHRDEFFKRMPKDVLLSNWAYEEYFEPNRCENYELVEPYVSLDKAGYDQLPCGSNWDYDESFGRMVEYSSSVISPEHLKGFLMASWMKTTPEFQQRHLQSIDCVGEEIRKWNAKKA